MCNFTTLIDLSLTQPYSMAGSKYKATWNGELNGKKITHIHRLGQLAAGVLLSIPLINIVAYQIFRLMADQNPQQNQQNNAQPAKPTLPAPIPASSNLTPKPNPNPVLDPSQSTPVTTHNIIPLQPEPMPLPVLPRQGGSIDLPDNQHSSLDEFYESVDGLNPEEFPLIPEYLPQNELTNSHQVKRPPQQPTFDSTLNPVLDPSLQSTLVTTHNITTPLILGPSTSSEINETITPDFEEYSVGSIISGDTTRIVNADLAINVRTTYAGDNNHYIEVSMTPTATVINNDGHMPMDFVFCIDVSGSMSCRMSPGSKQTRLDAVKDFLRNFLENIKNSGNLNGKTKVSLVTFNNKASLRLPVTSLTAENITKITEMITKLEASDGTSILEGLSLAAKQLEIMAKASRIASRTLVFLTDGEDILNVDKLKNVQMQLTQTSTNLIALGLGAEHKANVMQNIISHHNSDLPYTNFPNAVYQWIDDAINEDLPGKVRLSQAADLIYAQANQIWMHNVRLELGCIGTVESTVLNTGGKIILYEFGIPLNVTATKVIKVKVNFDETAKIKKYTYAFRVCVFPKDGTLVQKDVDVDLTVERNQEVFHACLIQDVLQEVAKTMMLLQKPTFKSSAASRGEMTLDDKIKCAQETLERVRKYAHTRSLKACVQSLENVYQCLLDEKSKLEKPGSQFHTDGTTHNDLMEISLKTFTSYTSTLNSSMVTRVSSMAGPSISSSTQ